MRIRRAIGSIATWLRRKPRLAAICLWIFPDLPWKIQIPPLGPFEIRLRRNRSMWLRDPLIHERYNMGAIRRFSDSKSVIYDAGANIGLYSRFFVQQCHAKAVVAFEPIAENRRLLRRNLTLGAVADSVTVVPMALSNKDGLQTIQIDDMSGAAASLDSVTKGQASQGRRDYGLQPKTIEIQGARLDTVVMSHHLPPPNVIKVDVEGA